MHSSRYASAMNHKLIMLDDESRQGQKVLGPSMIIRRQTATIWHYDQLIGAMRMEDSSSFFNYTRIETLRVSPRIQKSDTNFRRDLN